MTTNHPRATKGEENKETDNTLHVKNSMQINLALRHPRSCSPSCPTEYSQRDRVEFRIVKCPRPEKKLETGNVFTAVAVRSRLGKGIVHAKGWTTKKMRVNDIEGWVLPENIISIGFRMRNQQNRG